MKSNDKSLKSLFLEEVNKGLLTLKITLVGFILMSIALVTHITESVFKMAPEYAVIEDR